MDVIHNGVGFVRERSRVMSNDKSSSKPFTEGEAGISSSTVGGIVSLPCSSVR